GQTKALLFCSVLMSLPMLLSEEVRLLADAPLGFFVLASFACAYAWIESRHPDDLRLAALCAAGLIFTKSEGIGWFAILVTATAVTLAAGKRLREWRALASLVVIPLLVNAPWLVFRAHIPKVA